MECTRCGECCKGLGEILIFEEDVKRWKEEGRTDIMEHFSFGETEIKNEYLAGFVVDGKEVYKCPFLKENKNNTKCLIYNMRPTICRKNPKTDTNICNKKAYLKAAVKVCF